MPDDIDPTLLAETPPTSPLDRLMRRGGGIAGEIVRSTLPWTAERPHGGGAGERDPEPDYGEDARGRPFSGEEFVEPATFEEDPLTTVVKRDGPLAIRLELPKDPMRVTPAPGERWRASTVAVPAGQQVMLVDTRPNRRLVRFTAPVVDISIAPSDADAAYASTRVGLATAPLDLETSGEVWAHNSGGSEVLVPIVEIFEH